MSLLLLPGSAFRCHSMTSPPPVTAHSAPVAVEEVDEEDDDEEGTYEERLTLRRRHSSLNMRLTTLLLAFCSATAERARAHRDDVADLLSTATGIPQDVWRRALARHPFEVLRMNDDLVRSQQKVADRFRALGLVPVDIKVSDIVWRASV